MPIHNSDIADKLETMADLLAIQGSNKFRVRAYRNAAQTVRSLSKNVSHMIERDEKLTALSGIGEDLATKIHQIVRKGTFVQLEELKNNIPLELTELLQVEGLGPKRVKQLHQQLEISTLEELKECSEDGKIRQLDGFGAKTQQKILSDISQSDEEGRTRWDNAEERVLSLVNYLEDISKLGRITVAGSYRRRKETVGDIDILVTCQDREQAMNKFVDYEDVVEVEARGETKTTVILRSGLQVDLRVVPRESYGAALHYFTGSQSHNIVIRERGVKRDLKINEYGIYTEEQEKVGGAREEDVFESVELDYIPPELRENRGEIEAAQRGELPQLITTEDIKGDLQSHTTASDGNFSLREMALAARDNGLDYFAITDHSQAVSVANGLDPQRLLDQMDRIDEMNRQLEDIRLLKSSEVDILADGSLDLPDDVLRQLDVCICAVHSNFNLSYVEQTERVVTALRNQNCDILAHPTGRKINQREPLELDMEKVIEVARDHSCSLELNAAPQRLDLKATQCRMAKDRGVKVVISTDAHRKGELNWMRYGVGQARRGWLEPENVLNTRPWSEVKPLLSRNN